MKDYTNNKEDAEIFILNYDIEDDKIICHLASKEDYIIPYNEYNLQTVRRIMEAQINDDKYISQMNKKQVLNSILTAGLVTGSVVSFIALKDVDYGYLVSIAFFLTAGANSLKGTFTKEKVKDLCKNQFFLDNQEILNEHIKDNQNILSKVSKNAASFIENAEDNGNVLDINNLDNVTYEDLLQILKNIKRDQTFNFDYEKSYQENTPYTRVRKK